MHDMQPSPMEMTTGSNLGMMQMENSQLKDRRVTQYLTVLKVQVVPPCFLTCCALDQELHGTLFWQVFLSEGVVQGNLDVTEPFLPCIRSVKSMQSNIDALGFKMSHERAHSDATMLALDKQYKDTSSEVSPSTALQYIHMLMSWCPLC